MSEFIIKVSMEETLGLKGGTEPGEKDLWILGVPYSLVILEPFGYKLEYSHSLKIFFLFNLRNVLCSVMFINWLFECLFARVFFYSRYCKKKASVTHKRKSVY